MDTYGSYLSLFFLSLHNRVSPDDVTHFGVFRITLGNQLEGVRLVDPEIVKRFKEKYPDGNCMEPAKDKDGR